MSSARCGNHARIQKTSTGLAGPNSLILANGPEFVSRAILRWLLSAGIETACIDPGKPWQNGLDESFNGKFRDECLTLEWFRTRPEAMAVIESWRQHYNDMRPHSSLSQLTPAEFKESMQRRDEDSEAVTQGAIFQ
jgi:putative transposase